MTPHLKPESMASPDQRAHDDRMVIALALGNLVQKNSLTGEYVHEEERYFAISRAGIADRREGSQLFYDTDEKGWVTRKEAILELPPARRRWIEARIERQALDKRFISEQHGDTFGLEQAS